MVDRSRNLPTTGTFQRAGIACQSCRLRKVKCDAQSVSPHEACSPCRRAGQECLLDPSSDGRRRRSVNRKYVDKLQQRIETLEALNQSNQTKAQGSGGSPKDSSSAQSVTATICSRSTALPVDVTSTVHPQSSNRTNRSDTTILERSSSSQQTSWMSNLPRGKSPENSITSGGSPIFYGATSHPHVVSPSEDSGVVLCDEDKTVDIELDPSSPRLREELLRSFFKYQTLWVDIVNEESFLAHQAHKTQSRWYSMFLENAILASGARLSTSKAVRALAPKYFRWAKDDAISAMSEPSPAALQGFLLLSEYEVTQGNDRPGWMFCGVACRILSDLGLHELAGNIAINNETNESTRESDLAYSLLSACVVYEGVWTLYLGRPSSIPRSVMTAAFSRCKEARKADSTWLNAWVGLCIPMAEISHVLNDQSINGMDRSALLRKLFRQVEEWYENLPPDLTYNESRLTNMDLAGYGLHTQHCKVQILLRRALAQPLNTKKRRYSQFTNDLGSRASTDDSDAIIYRYALRIARLFVTYREAFGVEKIPSIMLDNAVLAATAMIAHLNNVGRADETQHEAVWLRQLVKSMETVQPHFPIVGRMLDALKQSCGSDLLSGTLISANHVPADAPINETPVLSRSKVHNSSSNNARGDFATVGGTCDNSWDDFDIDIDSSTFFAPGLDTFVLDLPASEGSASGFAQPLRHQDGIF